MFPVYLPVAVTPVGYMLIGAGGLAVIVLLLWWGTLWWETRNVMENEWTGDPGEVPMNSGVLLLLYVNEDELKSIANQRQVTPIASWTEQGFSNSQTRERRIWGKVFTRRRAKTKTQDLRQRVDTPPDNGSLLKQVLTSLASEYDLERDLDYIPSVDVDVNPLRADRDEAAKFLRQKLEMLFEQPALVTEEGVPEKVLDILEDFSKEGLVRMKRQDFEHVPHDRFILIESEWRVSSESGSAVLTLTKLRGRRSWEEIESDESRSIDVPDGVKIYVMLDEGAMTTRGKAELTHGDLVNVGVFGMVGSRSGGRLELTPVAVFRRMAGKVRDHVGIGC